MNAWMVIASESIVFDLFTVILDGDAERYQAFHGGDWVLIVEQSARGYGD